MKIYHFNKKLFTKENFPNEEINFIDDINFGKASTFKGFQKKINESGIYNEITKQMLSSDGHLGTYTCWIKK